MSNFRNHSLQIKILLTVFAVLCATLGPGTFYEYQSNVSRIEVNDQTEIESTVESLKKSLALPLWNFASVEAKEILLAVAKKNLIAHAYVFGADGSVFAEYGTLSSDPDRKDAKFEVTYRDKVIGHIELQFDRTKYRHDMQRALMFPLLRNILSLILILSLTTIYIRKVVVDRILRLYGDAIKLEHRLLDLSFSWKPGDEIDNLGVYLESARLTLKNSFSKLEAKNKELAELTTNLEKIVAEKTEQIVHQSRLASLGEMAAGIAHEINNPLAIISSGVLVLKKVRTDEEKFQLRSEAIEKAVYRIEKIVGGLRKYARTSGQVAWAPESISHILNEVMILVESKARCHDVTVSFDIRADGKILCDGLELEQVFINLINNAIDAVKDLETRWVRIHATENGSVLTVQVEDSGDGISSETAKKIFQPFFTTKKMGEGTGLGLYITKGILDQYRANFFVNQNFKNTCFEIQFNKYIEGKEENAA